MRTYYIEEKQAEMSYIELRLLLFIDCDIKYKKITAILNYLMNNDFLINLTTLYCEDLSANNFEEKEDVMSLTIDFVNDKMRFKFWNGASVFWLYHVEDVFHAVDTGRSEFSEIYDKYEPVTDILYDFQRRWRTSIHHVSYQYYPSDDDVELLYYITFSEEVKNTNYANTLLSKIGKEIQMLGSEITKDLNFRIKHSFRTSGCLPCEKARKEREQNERENKE